MDSKINRHTHSEVEVSFRNLGGHKHDGEDSTKIDFRDYSLEELNPIIDKVMDLFEDRIGALETGAAKGMGEFTSITIGGVDIWDVSPRPINLQLTTGRSFSNYEFIWIEATWELPNTNQGTGIDDNPLNFLVRDHNGIDSVLLEDHTSKGDQISGYEITIAKDGATERVVRTKSRGIRIEPVEPGIEYVITVVAINRLGVLSQPVSKRIIAAVDTTPPIKVEGVIASFAYRSVIITWDDNPDSDVRDGRGQYVVEISTESDFNDPNNRVVRVSGTLASISDLVVGQQYYIRVRAIDTSGNLGPWSDTIGGVPGGISMGDIGDGIPPSSSPDVELTPGFRVIIASWKAVENIDMTVYDVHMSKTSGFTPSESTLVGTSSGTFFNIMREPDDSFLEYGETYYVRLIARDPDGSAPPGAQASATISLIDGDDIGDNVITADHIVAGSLTSASGVFGDISANDIKTGTLDAAIVTVDNLSAERITSGTLNSDRIATASLTADKITGGTIGAGTIILNGVNSNLQSSTFSPGFSGWRIRGNGAAEFNDLSVRGIIHATGGSFSGNITSTATIQGGSISGTHITGSSTITGSIYRTATSGNRLEINPTPGSWAGASINWISSGPVASINWAAISGGELTIWSASDLRLESTYPVYIPAGINTWTVQAQGSIVGTSLSVTSDITLGTSSRLLRGGSTLVDTTGTWRQGVNAGLATIAGGDINATGNLNSFGTVNARDYTASNMNTSATATQAVHLNNSNSDMYRYTSSLFAKRNIRDINSSNTRDSLSVLHDLRPVIFDPIESDSIIVKTKDKIKGWEEQEGMHKNILGLIAEEVDAVSPQLSTRDPYGVAIGVNDRALITLLVDVCQKLSSRVSALEGSIKKSIEIGDI